MGNFEDKENNMVKIVRSTFSNSTFSRNAEISLGALTLNTIL
jgi:hypothetical protein